MDYMVSVCCITYNQEQYIRTALESFVSQRTNFDFEIVISNDCSSDDSQQIINEFKTKYSNIRDISPQKNLGAIKNFYYALNECRGKYIAFCEGDDYWIDENKLQNQVDFLEANSDFGMCYTKTKYFFQEKNCFARHLYGNRISSINDLIQKGNRIQTLTVCIRKDLILQYLSEVNPAEKQWLMGDYPMWLFAALNSKIFFIDKCTACYRVLNNSASHSPDENKLVEFEKSVYEVRKFFAAKARLQIDNFDELRTRFYIDCQFMKISDKNQNYRKNVRTLYFQMGTHNISEFANLLLSYFSVFLKLYKFIKGV